MAEGFDDLEMKELGNKYPGYDDMDNTTLDNEYNQLTNERLDLLHIDNPTRLEEVQNRMRYIEYIRGTDVVETTFTSNGDGKTITINRKGQRSNSAPEVQFDTKIDRPMNRVLDSVQEFIHRNYDNNFRFSEGGNGGDREMKLRFNIHQTTNNNITYKPLTVRQEMNEVLSK